MKTILKVCAATFLFSLPAMAADQEVGFPEEGPLITLTIPDGWLHEYQGGMLHAASSQDLDTMTMMTVKPLTATKKQGSEAVAEIKEELAKSYGENIEYDKIEEGGTSNLGYYVLNAEAKVHSANEGDVTSFINSLIVTMPDSDELLLVQFASTAAGSKKNGEAIGEIIQSFKKVE